MDDLRQRHTRDRRRQEGHDHAPGEQSCSGIAGQADRHVPQLAPVDRDHRQDRAELNDDGEGLPAIARDAQQPFGNQQMAGGGHGQELGKALNDPEQDRVNHVVHGYPADVS